MKHITLQRCTPVILQLPSHRGAASIKSRVMEGEMKSTNERSLRFQVEKWLAPGSTTSVHVVEFSRTQSGRRRYVYVETSQPGSLRALFFFRHDDGCWRVFPPAVDKLPMSAESDLVSGRQQELWISAKPE
ncbi:hypothetical protein N234_35387 [Ralstonia pickettii DTP0602]|nr:hypothetical protein N234_35387 [Ralstonia pickettii DTP0602]